MKTSFIILLMLALAAACNKPKTLTSAEEEAILKEAQKVTSELLSKMEVNDTTALFSFFSQRPDIIMIMGNDVYKQSEFVTMARGFLGNLEKQTLENGTQNFTVLDANTFVFNWKGLNKAYGKSGVVTIWDPIVLSYVFQKEEAGWKVIYGHEGWANMRIDSSMLRSVSQ